MVVWPAGSELLTAVNSVDGVSGEKTFCDKILFEIIGCQRYLNIEVVEHHFQ